MWGQLITSVLMTVAGRIIAAFGLSFVSYVGMNEIQQFLMEAINAQIGGFPDEALQIVMIAGLGVMLNWIFGAFAFVVSIKSLSKLSTIVSQK